MELELIVPLQAGPITCWDKTSIRKLSETDRESLRQLLDAFGKRSAKAQSLGAPVTDIHRLASSDQRLYLHAKRIPGGTVIFGGLKCGSKRLFVRTDHNALREVDATCVLDFYVHESCQRQGIGRALFEHLLEVEHVQPAGMAYDRPSPKLLAFLKKHYGLSSYVPQSNNFVLYDSYWQLNPPSQLRQGQQTSSSRSQQGITSARQHATAAHTDQQPRQHQSDHPTTQQQQQQSQQYAMPHRPAINPITGAPMALRPSNPGPGSPGIWSGFSRALPTVPACLPSGHQSTAPSHHAGKGSDARTDTMQQQQQLPHYSSDTDLSHLDQTLDYTVSSTYKESSDAVGGGGGGLHHMRRMADTLPAPVGALGSFYHVGNDANGDDQPAFGRAGQWAAASGPAQFAEYAYPSAAAPGCLASSAQQQRANTGHVLPRRLQNGHSPQQSGASAAMYPSPARGGGRSAGSPERNHPTSSAMSAPDLHQHQYPYNGRGSCAQHHQHVQQQHNILNGVGYDERLGYDALDSFQTEAVARGLPSAQGSRPGPSPPSIPPESIAAAGQQGGANHHHTAGLSSYASWTPWALDEPNGDASAAHRNPRSAVIPTYAANMHGGPYAAAVAGGGVGGGEGPRTCAGSVPYGAGSGSVHGGGGADAQCSVPSGLPSGAYRQRVAMSAVGGVGAVPVSSARTPMLHVSVLGGVGGGSSLGSPSGYDLSPAGGRAMARNVAAEQRSGAGAANCMVW